MPLNKKEYEDATTEIMKEYDKERDKNGGCNYTQYINTINILKKYTDEEEKPTKCWGC
jgi:hypothetical protein